MALLSAALLCACGTSDDTARTREVVQRFYSAVDAHRGADACAVLTSATAEQIESEEQKPCRESVVALAGKGDSHVARAAVYATSAKVDLDDGSSAFLSLEHDGWKISAIDCTPSHGKPADRPFECGIES